MGFSFSVPSKGREFLLAVFKAVRRHSLPLEVVEMGLFMASLLFILLLFSLPWAGAALRLVSDIPEMVLGNIRHQLFTQRVKL